LNYLKEYTSLKKLLSGKLPAQYEDFVLKEIEFKSNKSIDFSSNIDEEKTNIFNALLNYYLQNNTASNDYIFRNLNAPDNSFPENNNFSYLLFSKDCKEKCKSVIILLHGLNEKNWEKYLTWAKYLCEKTGKAILMFPLAFHMNRAPMEWSNSRLMYRLSKERMGLFPKLQSSTFVNAAISTRLQFSPERFLLSGLQTLYDIIELVEEIRKDNNTHIAHDATVDFFGYSIGGFLGQILLMSNQTNLLADSRLLVFCGGATFDKSSPASRAIMDSEATEAIKGYYLNEFDKCLEKDTSLNEVFAKSGEVGEVFKCMLNSAKMISFRNALMGSLKRRLRILTLEKDMVFSPRAVTESYMIDLSKSIVRLDFPYPYTHETPFPTIEKTSDEVYEAFKHVFDYASEFLG